MCWLGHQSRPHKCPPSWQVGNGDYTERSLISAIRANLGLWKKMAEMEAGGHGLYHMVGSSLPVCKVSKKMTDSPAEVPRPRRLKVWLQVRTLRLRGHGHG